MRLRTTLIVSSFLILAITTAGVYRAKAYKEEGTEKYPQNSERTVVDLSSADTPVKIILIKTKKRTIEKGRQFLDGDDWLHGITFRVLNRSEKTVTYVGIRFLFRRPPDQA